MAAYRAYGTINTGGCSTTHSRASLPLTHGGLQPTFCTKKLRPPQQQLSRLNFCGVPKPGWHRLCGNRYPGGCDQQPPGTGVFAALYSLSQYTNNTKWVDLMLEYKFKPRQGRLVEMNLSYGHNIGGLSNTIGPILGLGFAYRLNKKSTLCKLDNIYDVNCYDFNLT